MQASEVPGASHARPGTLSGLRIGVTGSSGLVGSALLAHLRECGVRCTRFVRSAQRGRTPDSRIFDPRACVTGSAPPDLSGLDAIVHLAGASIAAGRWSRRRKTEILESRVLSTRTLAAAIAQRAPLPLICASAIGYYGDTGEALVDESSPMGRGFLAEVVYEWEGAAQAARDAGGRVVHARLGVVLAREGGALHAMLPAFRCGLGGPVGPGTQGFSWISLVDAVRAIAHCIADDRAHGPVNLVAPDPRMQREFARALGRACRRPAIVPLPSPLIRLALGEMGRALLLEGAFVRPTRLTELGFKFAHPTLDEALRALVANPRA